MAFIDIGLPLDKTAHLIIGFIIVLCAHPIFSVYLTKKKTCCALSFVIVFSIALIKEIVDQINYGGFDFYDLLYTLVGGVAFIAIYYMYNNIFVIRRKTQYTET